MKTKRPRLQIPAELIITAQTLAMLSCSPPMPTPDAGDSGRDSAQVTEAGSCDRVDSGNEFASPCARVLSDQSLESCGQPCTTGQCPSGCRLCETNQFASAPGVACLPRVGSTTTCPRRVCTTAECPTGCETCESPLFCIPDMAGMECQRSNTCDVNGCGAGCRAVG
ncbi:MAG: hypothetical protein Q8Q09_09350 [Deltaproteobacteria bacterium]|nr:hypothetical protein [Deltaproteobacteria bacterium]